MCNLEVIDRGIDNIAKATIFSMTIKKNPDIVENFIIEIINKVFKFKALVLYLLFNHSTKIQSVLLFFI